MQRLSYKLLEDHRVSTNIHINERLWTGRFGVNGTSLMFICCNRFFYLGATVKLWNYWMYFTMKVLCFVCYRRKKEKQTTVMKRLSIYFGHHSLAFLNSFLNILNKYVLILNKYNLEYVISFIHKFVLAIFWWPRANEMGARTEERG